MKQDLLKGLTKEQVEKLRKCKNHEEILALAKKEGIELSDEQLQYVAGGECEEKWVVSQCPRCGLMVSNDDGNECRHFTCLQCNISWTIDR